MALRASDIRTVDLVADASVWINLAASGRMEDILSALSVPVGVPLIALQELKRGQARGYDAFTQVDRLVQIGLVVALNLESQDESLFLELVSGETAETLDDGEAATLALSVRMNAMAAIDERKATTLAGRLFKGLVVRSTTELMFDALPHDDQAGGPLADALFGALKGARMRVPQHLQARVAEVLGPDRVRDCPSLPASLRTSFLQSKVRLL